MPATLLRFLFALTLTILSAHPSFSTEMRVIPNPMMSDLKEINLIKSLRRYRERFINLNKVPYECITAVKQSTKDSVKSNLPKFFKKDEKAFQDLSLLVDDFGVRHYTKEFIYVYKHDKIVSQVDDEFTKHNNQKKKFENFTLGTTVPGVSTAEPQHSLNPIVNNIKKVVDDLVNNPQKTISASVGVSVDAAVKEITEKLLNQGKDQTSANSETKQEPSLSAMKVESGKLQFQIDYQNQIIRSSVPLHKNPLTKVQCYTAKCKVPSNTTTYTMIRVIAVSNFELYMQTNIKQCEKVMSIEPMVGGWTFDFSKTLGFLNRIVYGDIDRLCTFQGTPSADIGDTFLFNVNMRQANGQMKESYYIASILDILGENVYKIDGMMHWDTKLLNCKKLSNFSQQSSFRGQIPLLPQGQSPSQPITSQDKIHHVQYINEQLIKSDDVTTGQELQCFTWINILQQWTILSMPMVVGGSSIQSGYYYAFYMLSEEGWKMNQIDNFFEFDPKFTCVELDRKQNISSVSRRVLNPLQRLSTVIKVTQHKELQNISNQDNENLIFYITLPEDGIVEIVTERQHTKDTQTATKQDSNGGSSDKKTIRNKYFLTHKKIYLSENVMENGTLCKREQGENSFYQNSTSSGIIILHKSIWRVGDLLKFPRIAIHDNERIRSIKVKFGHAFVRMMNAGSFGKDNFAASSSQLEKHQGYGPKVRPIESLSTQKRLKLGTHCGNPINKNRQTLVKIRCGQPWFHIKSVKEVSPCSYQLEVQSQYLCAKGTLFPLKSDSFQTFQGSICIPTGNGLM